MSEHILIGAKKAVISAACGICALPESELLKRLEELYLTGFKAAVDVTIKDHDLYHRVNEMLAILGAEGEIDTRHKTVTAVMDCLHDIDGGMYEANRRAPSAEQQQQEPVAWYREGNPIDILFVEEMPENDPANPWYPLYAAQQPQAQGSKLTPEQVERATESLLNKCVERFHQELSQPQAPQVSDAMVAAAVMAYVQHGKNRSGDMFAAMRTALEAALSKGEGE